MAIGIIINSVTRSGYLDKTEAGKGGASQHQVIKGQRGTMTLNLRAPPGDTWAAAGGPQTGQTISIYNQLGHADFAGLISQVVTTYEGNTLYVLWQLQCDSYERMMDRHTVPPQSYFNQTCGSIFTSVFNSIPTEGVTLGTIDAGPTISQLIFNRQRASDCFDQLATLAGYVWAVDPNTGAIFFRDPTDSGLALPSQLTGDPATGYDCKWDSIKWTVGNLDFVTTQHVQIALSAFSPDTDIITGNGSSTSFTLRFEVDTVTQILLLAGPAVSVGSSTLADLNPQPLQIYGGSGPTFASFNYYFVTSFTGTAGEVQVLLSGNLQQTLQNLADAINGAPTTGSNYQVNSGSYVYGPVPNTLVQASAAGTITISAITPGDFGNTIVVGDLSYLSPTGLTWSGNPAPGTNLWYLTGGSDGPERAQVIGTFTGQPSNNDTVTIDSTLYTFVNSLSTATANQTSYYVLIGANRNATASNLAAAITGNPSPGAGAAYSYPSFPHTTTVASYTMATNPQVTVFAKTNGEAGNSIAVSASITGGVFSWATATLEGGTGGPTATQTLGQVGDGSASQWFWQQGKNTVIAAAAPANNVMYAVTYYRLGQDVITAENTALTILRAAIETGSGIYQALESVTDSTDPVSTNPKAALERAQSLLKTYGVLPETMEFETETPGIKTGWTLTVNLPATVGGATFPFYFLNGTYTIQQIDANYIPGMPGWRYTIQCTAVSSSPPAALPTIWSAVKVFQKMAEVRPVRQAPIAKAQITGPPAGGGGSGPTIQTKGATFIFSPPNTAAVNLTVNSITSTVTVQTGGTMASWRLVGQAKPTGSTVIIDVLRLHSPSSDPTTPGNWHSIFQGMTGSPLTSVDYRPVMPANTAVEQTGTQYVGNDSGRSDYELTAVVVNPGDQLYAVIDQVGSTLPGGSFTLDIFWM